GFPCPGPLSERTGFGVGLGGGRPGTGMRRRTGSPAANAPAHLSPAVPPPPPGWRRMGGGVARALARVEEPGGGSILTRSVPPRPRAGPPGRDPETDVSHVAPPAAPVPSARSTPSPSPAPATARPPLPPAR